MTIARGIRARATFTAVTVMGAAVAGASVALVLLLQQSLLRDVDARAVLRLQDVAALAERGQLPATLGGGDEDGTVAQVVANGQVLAQSPILHDSETVARFVPPPGATTVRTVHRPPIEGAAPDYRVAARRVATSSGPAVVYAAASLEPVADSIHALVILLAVVAPLLVVLVGLIIWWLVGRTLEPVEAIRRQVAEISVAELTVRVPDPDTGDEIHRLAETMNTMLDRLEAAVTGQRRFVSDAAHELRSPLAAIGAELDVAASHPTATDWRALVDRLGTSTGRLQRLVEDLLVLATAEERGLRARGQVDLDEILIRQLEPLRAAGRLAIHVDLDAARVSGDRDQLERVVANLLDNAARHATSAIDVTLHVDDGAAELVIADDGPGVAVKDRQRVFERFSRLDGARDRHRGGAGLGLAIARRIVEDHAGTVGLTDSDKGARMVVRLPVGDAP